jgi:hypothetical protein
LEQRAVEALAGRRAELERLEVFALGEEPLVMHIQGIPGTFKREFTVPPARFRSQSRAAQATSPAKKSRLSDQNRID